MYQEELEKRSRGQREHTSEVVGRHPSIVATRITILRHLSHPGGEKQRLNRSHDFCCFAKLLSERKEEKNTRHILHAQAYTVQFKCSSLAMLILSLPDLRHADRLKETPFAFMALCVSVAAFIEHKVSLRPVDVVPFVDKPHPTVWLYHPLFIHSSDDDVRVVSTSKVL